MDKEYTGSAQYIVSPELQRCVRVAMAMGKPLLVKGEPGTGKTMLAESVSQAMGMPLYRWNIKSTTKAQEGLYHYDTVQRLYDSQFGGTHVEDIRHYIKLGPLGQALKSPQQTVLLIDEIDKADLEFPNDLLWELDRMEFYIPETGDTIRANYRPVVIITSNSEKELPDAFLRRCMFHYIAFPEPEEMDRIVRTHFPELDHVLLEKAMELFYRLRRIPDLQKKPGTSELLDWLQALEIGGIEPEELDFLPIPGMLIKKQEDMELLQRQDMGNRRHIR